MKVPPEPLEPLEYFSLLPLKERMMINHRLAFW
jgi:hypothetical protein